MYPNHWSDWITQRWVEVTGRKVHLVKDSWLNGPIGKPSGIGATYFNDLAQELGFDVIRGNENVGLISDFYALKSNDFEPKMIQDQVIEFYENTGAYEMDAWAEWCGAFRPFGGLLAVMFSRRLQQLNVPLSGLDTSKGMTSEVIQLIDRQNQGIKETAWIRTLVGTGNVLYAGSYSTCRVPGYEGDCIKVVFPLPNGNAMVIMKPEAHEDGSFSVVSAGSRFGDPGFYFTVHNKEGKVSARYVSSMKERIHVYAGEDAVVRADHELKLWGITFLRLHYRMKRTRGRLAA